jgi:predicted dehydrogenase
MTHTSSVVERHAHAPLPPPRLGFLGVGWIGRLRMTALLREQPGTVIAVADPDAGAAQEAALAAGGALVLPGLEELLELELDGVVIATPSAMHAEQAITALAHGVAVFVQKPLARDAAEADAVLTAAERTGRPLGVDLSYRHTAAARAMREALRVGRIGEVFAAQLVFHNAYGPDKPWFLDRRHAGGGCVIDLGTHLLDLLLWLLDEDAVAVQAATLLREGRRMAEDAAAVEDFAAVQLTTAAGIPVQLACSWFLPAGCDCVFECALYGTAGSLLLSNLGGSFYDFTLESRHGTESHTLVTPPDEWGGRALCAWARALQRGDGFDASKARELRALTRAIDAIYDAGGRQR